MREVAADLRLSYDRFRKAWPAMAEREGLPRPFRERFWDAEALARWKAERSAGGAPPAAPAPSPPPPPRRKGSIAQLRRA